MMREGGRERHITKLTDTMTSPRVISPMFSRILVGYYVNLPTIWSFG